MPIPQNTIDELIATYENNNMVSRKDDPSMSTRPYANEVYTAIQAVHPEALKQSFKDANQEYTPVIYNSEEVTSAWLSEEVSHWD